ncbi:MAG: hypothetical protein LBD23_07855 [Oscillospiraceae bacterium]|jgi:hypothetical protein|nr:hypothetical protein [Oscillospiraceae bacterium]
MKTITDFKNAFGEADDSFKENVKNVLAKLRDRQGSTIQDSQAQGTDNKREQQTLRNSPGQNSTAEELSIQGIPTASLAINKAPHREALLRSPRRFSRRLVLVAVITILTLLTTAFALAYYLSSFDRLRDIVGDDVADTLQPLEIVNATEEDMLNKGFRIELVAVGVNYHTIDLYLTLEDTIGDRLGGDVEIMANIRATGNPNLPPSSTRFSNIINRTDDGVITLHLRKVLIYPITERVRFELYEIHHNNEITELAWNFIFEVELTNEEVELLVRDDLEIMLEDGLVVINEVHISPYNVYLKGVLSHPDQDLTTILTHEVITAWSEIEVYINMADDIYDPVFVSFTGWYSQSIDYANEKIYLETMFILINDTDAIATGIDLSKVTSIDINGHVVEFG